MLTLATAGTAAVGAAHRVAAAAKAPAGGEGSFSGVAAVPHSSTVWAYGLKGPALAASPGLARRQGGHWHNVKSPAFEADAVDTIAAGSAGTVWLGGKNKSGHPAIYRWNGKKFVSVSLPKLQFGAVQSIAASSASNAWAVSGQLKSTGGQYVALHWDGKKWSAVSAPEGMKGVSTSGATNAWALGYNGDFVHWNGHTWAAAGTLPDVTLTATATSSPTKVDAVGGSTVGSKTVPVDYRLNGSTWSPVSLPNGLPHDALTSITRQGHSLWAAGPHVILHSTGHGWAKQLIVKGLLSLSSVSASSPKRAWAVGAHVVNPGTPQLDSKTLAETYNGHSWKGAASKI